MGDVESSAGEGGGGLGTLARFSSKRIFIVRGQRCCLCSLCFEILVAVERTPFLGLLCLKTAVSVSQLCAVVLIMELLKF